MNSLRETVRAIKEKFELLQPLLDERLRRLWAGSEARSLGTGGITLVCQATKLSRTTVRNGMRELEAGIPDEEIERVRRPGAGRPRLERANPELLVRLEELVDPLTRGDPESPLRWTAKSGRKLAAEMAAHGFKVSPQKVHALLKSLGYSLQANRKSREGIDHPERDEQFGYINRQVKSFMRDGQPVISVDTKKKELIGDFKNGGKEWQPKGVPSEVRVHDFIDKELGKVIPYGVYDVGANQGWVNVGTDHDTPEFAVESIRRWWNHMGKKRYPGATRLLITADAGGSNGYRARAWKYHLHRLALDIDLEITVCHFPPGTSKWNKIEHRMFSHITMNWRGRPLVSHEVVVNLIANTTTAQGLKIRAKLDERIYPKGEQISDEDLAAIPLAQARTRGAWNYRISPVECA
jgi:hypothetical protein